MGRRVMFGMGSWGRVRAGGRKEEGSGGERGEYRGQGGENYDESGGVYRAPRVISLTKGTGKACRTPHISLTLAPASAIVCPSATCHSRLVIIIPPRFLVWGKRACRCAHFYTYRACLTSVRQSSTFMSALPNLHPSTVKSWQLPVHHPPKGPVRRCLLKKAKKHDQRLTNLHNNHPAKSSSELIHHLIPRELPSNKLIHY